MVRLHPEPSPRRLAQPANAEGADEDPALGRDRSLRVRPSQEKIHPGVTEITKFLDLPFQNRLGDPSMPP